MAKNAFYAQSGGVTAVINASACGVIETARRHTDKIARVYAGRNGIIGALTEDLIDTSMEDDAAIAALRYTPSGAFGSCRFKLKDLEKSKREYERLIEVFLQIVDVLDADRDPYHVVGQANLQASFRRYRRVRHRRGMRDECFDAAQAFGQGHQPNAVEQRSRPLQRAELERDQSAESAHLPARERVLRVRGEPGVMHA